MNMKGYRKYIRNEIYIRREKKKKSMQNVRKYINIRNEKKTQRKKEIATTGEVAVFAQHDRGYFLSTQLK